jgi:hypothetical protein
MERRRSKDSVLNGEEMGNNVLCHGEHAPANIVGSKAFLNL